MNEIIIKTSIWKSALAMVCCLAFVATGIFILWINDGELRGYLIAFACFIFFGGGFFVLLYQLLNREPRIIIDEIGIVDRTLAVGKIYWKDVENSRFMSIYSNKFIYLKLSNPEKYIKDSNKPAKIFTKFEKSPGVNEVSLNLSLVNMKPKKILEIVNERIHKT